jgi:hypothetical protein
MPNSSTSSQTKQRKDLSAAIDGISAVLSGQQESSAATTPGQDSTPAPSSSNTSSQDDGVPPHDQEHAEQAYAEHIDAQRQKARMVRAGTIALATVVLLVWGVNAVHVVKDITEPSSTGSLLDTAQQDLNELFGDQTSPTQSIDELLTTLNGINIATTTTEQLDETTQPNVAPASAAEIQALTEQLRALQAAQQSSSTTTSSLTDQ